MPFILALDQGTTSSRAIVFDRQGRIQATAQKELTQHFPASGWVEHEPAEIWQTQLDTAREALADAGLHARDVAAIGIANQRETTLIWDRRTGQPLHRAIVWQDRRTAELCRELQPQAERIGLREKTGLVLDPYFSASKIRWLLDHLPEARPRAEAGELAFGTVDTWLLWQLTQGQQHVTDPTNASRTLLYNLHTADWDPDLLTLFDIPADLLPRITPSSGVMAHSNADLFGQPIPIAGVAGDQQAALFGQACFQPGLAKNTYGTGCFMLMATGPQPTVSQHQLLTTAAWHLASEAEQPQHALEGSVFIAGAVVQWLRDQLGLIQSASEIEALAQQVEDTGGVTFVPAFAGLGAPHWDPLARGSIHGLTRGTGKAHLARAALEAIAHQVADVLDVMQQDAGTPIQELRVAGGGSVNALLMQFQADLLGVPVIRPTVTETTALGAAYLAGLAVGYWQSLEEIATNWAVDRVFEPSMPAKQVQQHRRRWHEALSRSRAWAER